MTDLQQIAFDKLTAALWSGQLSEKAFKDQAPAIGASLAAIAKVLQELREEDNVGC